VVSRFQSPKPKAGGSRTEQLGQELAAEIGELSALGGIPKSFRRCFVEKLDDMTDGDYVFRHYVPE